VTIEQWERWLTNRREFDAAWALGLSRALKQRPVFAETMRIIELIGLREVIQNRGF